MNKKIIILVLTLILFFTGCFINKQPDDSVTKNSKDPDTIAEINSGDIKLCFRAVKSSFYFKGKDNWERKYLKGINVGLSLPTTNLNNPNVSYNVYMDWLKDISAMNVNTVKVFTIMNPDFYNALYDFNLNNRNPLYLLQGVWFNENYMYDIRDAFGDNGTIINQFKKATKEIIDIVNGNMSNYTYGTQSGLEYKKDISNYVAGFVLGLEYPPEFVNTTNTNNPSKTNFAGDFLYTQNGTPFESFLCEVGDNLIKYESEKYLKQHPVAFLNWSPLDTLTHSNEPFKEENDGAVLNTEHILKTDKYFAGLFAAIDIYPYYPEFMNYQKEYLDFLENGKPNTYRAYLKDLFKTYTVPVVVAEFGIPTSRGKSHESAMGYNQGFADEVSQGQMVLKMMQDINSENYAGGMIFAWQDEWFKQVWNIFKYAPNDTLKRASNAMAAEQFYGILAYEPGEGQSVCYPDGDISEWAEDKAVFSSDRMELFTKNDERYLYIMCKIKGQYNFDQDSAVIALGTTDRGNLKDNSRNLTFEKPTDFIIEIKGKNNSRLFVDAYYDYFYYTYSYKKGIFERNKKFEAPFSGIFNPHKTFISNEMYLPVDKKTIPPKAYESGILTLGNANPNGGDFNNLTDFSYRDGNMEIRIPWWLLNIFDPADVLGADDFYKAGRVKLAEIKDFYIGGVTGNAKDVKMSKFDVPGYAKAKFHKRLKKSYDIIKDGLLKIN